jgi:hypothetical protein
MSRIVDNLIAYKVLSMLVTQFEDTPAYKLGIIDVKGRNIKKSSELQTGAEKDAYSYLHRLVFNLKKLINKLPGGESKLKSLVAALFLIKEYYEKNDRSLSLMEEKFNRLMASDAILAEELILVEKFVNEQAYCESCDCVKSKCKCEVTEDAPANATGAAVSTDRATIKKKDVNKYIKTNQGALALTRRAKPV